MTHEEQLDDLDRQHTETIAKWREKCEALLRSALRETQEDYRDAREALLRSALRETQEAYRDARESQVEAQEAYRESRGASSVSEDLDLGVGYRLALVQMETLRKEVKRLWLEVERLRHCEDEAKGLRIKLDAVVRVANGSVP